MGREDVDMLGVNSVCIKGVAAFFTDIQKRELYIYKQN